MQGIRGAHLLQYFVLIGIIAAVHPCKAQSTAISLEPVPSLAFTQGPLTLRQSAVPNRPFTVTGTGGAILGMQDGTVELWQFPMKFFSGLHLRALVDGYPVPIDLNSAAATLDVSPDHTTLTYSHAAITVRQHMFVPAGEGNQGMGGVIVFEIQSIRPATLTISLTPAMVRQWPAPQYGQPSWSWQSLGKNGLYVVSTDDPEFFGLIALAGATPGVIVPYQEHPRTLPLEFNLRFDPAHDAGHMFPLLCEVAHLGERNSPQGIAALAKRLASRSGDLAAIWTRTQAYYSTFFDTRVTVHTPDPQFDKAIAWAELAIDKAQVATSGGEVGLVAGWYPSFDSARPGFGWFFGRDTLWSIYAIDSYADVALSRRAIDFLVRRQREDGKMMHEFSQTAEMLTGHMEWSKAPYEYAAADSTPLYLLAMQDYIRTTGDMAYLKNHWESLQRAYHFERNHDSDGDGVYDNSQGTGWVEGWPPKLPHQEFYLAALDRDAASAMAQLAEWMGDQPLSKQALATSEKLTISLGHYRLGNGTYAFSKEANGNYDSTQTVYPAVALWLSGNGMAQPDTMLSAWSSHQFATDWGTRAVSKTDPVYDPISYHQGSVWPLFTGWTAMAQYRSGRPLEGFDALQHNVDLTWAQDLGSVTEVLSGRFYQPLGRSSTHQLWSSAMVLAPALRGLFGVEADAPHHALLVNPQLPATWDHTSLDNVLVGDALFSVSLQRAKNNLDVVVTGIKPSVLCLRRADEKTAADCHEPPATEHHLHLPLPPFELQLLSESRVHFGDSTTKPHVISERREARSLTVIVEAFPGSTVRFAVRQNGTFKVSIQGGSFNGNQLLVPMPAGSEESSTTIAATESRFVTREVSLRW